MCHIHYSPFYLTLIGSGALDATSFCSRISSHNAAGITVFNAAALSSAIGSGLIMCNDQPVRIHLASLLPSPA